MSVFSFLVVRVAGCGSDGCGVQKSARKVPGCIRPASAVVDWNILCARSSLGLRGKKRNHADPRVSGNVTNSEKRNFESVPPLNSNNF
jgi:hypothetical protein